MSGFSPETALQASQTSWPSSACSSSSSAAASSSSSTRPNKAQMGPRKLAPIFIRRDSNLSSAPTSSTTVAAAAALSSTSSNAHHVKHKRSREALAPLTPLASSSQIIASSSPDCLLLTPTSSSQTFKLHSPRAASQSSPTIHVDNARKRVKVDHALSGHRHDTFHSQSSPLARTSRRDENTPIGRMDIDDPLSEDDDEEEEDEASEEQGYASGVVETKRRRMGNMKSYFHTSTVQRDERWGHRARQVESKNVYAETASSVQVPIDPPTVVWRRQRKRFGMGAGSSSMGMESVLDMSRMTLAYREPAFLPSLVTSLLPYHPDIQPSAYHLPSVHPVSGRPRDYSPPLAVAFNSVAKNYDAISARESGRRRMIAIAGEEGGVRIFDVDEGLGVHKEEKGWWWRAHANAVFDIKWSGDDRRILTSSGDQTTRIHALTTPTPTLLATLNGHTSSVKTTVFFDPTRSHMDASTHSSVVASGGRDGHILIYDLRCQGRSREVSETPSNSSGRSGSSERYSHGISGFAAQTGGDILNPVMAIKGAHGDGSKRSNSRTALRSVTSLVALQAMPGVLASGGNYDGIVKLWDLRFAAATNRHPNPRPTYKALGILPDPTIHCANPSRRARSVNALVESPTNGDLFALCGDSKIHALRPAAMQPEPQPLSSSMAEEQVSMLPSSSRSSQSVDTSAILPRTYTHPSLLVSSFYLRASISPDGKHIACGSSRGGIMCWDVDGKADEKGEVTGVRLSMGGRSEKREVSAVDWGKDMMTLRHEFGEVITKFQIILRGSQRKREPTGWGQSGPDGAASPRWYWGS